MEGNECYKFSTIVNYTQVTRAADVRVMVDIGANVGAISLMMKSYFPAAKLYGYEPVDEYFQTAVHNARTSKGIHLFNKAVTSAHLYFDDLGEKPRQKTASLIVFKALPEGGPGFAGGSVVVPDDHAMARPGQQTTGYQRMEQRVYPITLDTIWKNIRDAEGVNEIDLVKIDCEGDENNLLGCAKPATLKKIRYIVGEYHNIERFYNVMRTKLFKTHKVNLIGQRDLGCFFAERLDGQRDEILLYSKDGMLQARPWLSKHPIDWHLFNSDFVPHEAWSSHALP